MSETAAPTNSAGVGWIDQALIDMACGPAGSPGRISDVMSKLRLFRVGGEFWGARPQLDDEVRIAVRAKDRRTLEEKIAAALELGDHREIVVLLPRGAPFQRAARSLARRGFSSVVGPVDPWSVLDHVKSVVVDGDDELGLLGLVASRSVHCTSMGYLVGWGATHDAAHLGSRGKRQAWQVAAAALVEGVRYLDPFTRRVTSCEAILDQLADWRRIVDQDRNVACLSGVALWKRAHVRRLMAPLGRPMPAYTSATPSVARAKRRGGAIAVWPSRAPRGLDDKAQQAGVPIVRIEDGFVRSVGLGSDLLPPCSIVVDRKGIYYDPSRPSDLEAILFEEPFAQPLLERAEALIATLVALRLTKYNTGGGGYARPARRRVVLVAGQVEDDQSWRLGGGGCSGNLDLLRRVRDHEPDAFVVYKPHPDVEAGNRVGAVPDADVLKYADQIVRDVSIPALLDGVDAVHVLTSLTGFEALLRGREVIVHGQPFYSGWGLTKDLSPPPRRGRQLNLAELVAGALILYPRYIDPDTGVLCPPEVLIDRIASRRPGFIGGAAPVRRARQLVQKLLKGLESGSSVQAQLNVE